MQPFPNDPCAILHSLNSTIFAYSPTDKSNYDPDKSNNATLGTPAEKKTAYPTSHAAPNN